MERTLGSVKGVGLFVWRWLAPPHSLSLWLSPLAHVPPRAGSTAALVGTRRSRRGGASRVLATPRAVATPSKPPASHTAARSKVELIKEVRRALQLCSGRG